MKKFLFIVISSLIICSTANAWGTWRFLGEPSGWINPHKYWTGGVGKPECFVEGRKYPDGLLTLPVECKN